MSAVRTTSDPIAGDRHWRAGSIDATANWYYPLPNDCLTAMDESVMQLRQNPRPVTEFRLTEIQREICHDAIEPVRAALEKGRGFAVIDRVPVERYSIAESQLIYWLVGQLLGEPFEQNVQGTLLYDVRDSGKTLEQGARFSVTNYESSFHTDNSFGEDVLDYVGLLCLTTAKSGGLSQVLSAYAVYDEMRARHPQELATLCQPFHVDRRGGTREGDSPTVQFPVVQRKGDELLVRYLRYWIEVGHQKVLQPLTPAQQSALDTLDEVLRRPDLRVEFMLRPGEMFWINNRWILHNRTAFEDHTEPDRRRHYVRLWVKARH